ncbi:Laminin subunit beta-1 [Taenia crassiceps]|uniref:Laminin subunit beta-1 n=1 Tax=Taenia crassiceps TaxID=6207 RepID=A0ABR4QTM0_9CEST
MLGFAPLVCLIIFFTKQCGSEFLPFRNTSLSREERRVLNTTVMCVLENTRITKGILREMLGFKGFVISDEGSHPRCLQRSPLLVAAGIIRRYQLEEMNRPLFLARMRQGEFDPPESNPYASLNKDDFIQSPKHRQLSLVAGSSRMPQYEITLEEGLKEVADVLLTLEFCDSGARCTSGDEDGLIKLLNSTKANVPDVIVVTLVFVYSAGSLNISDAILSSQVKSILWFGYPGQEAGRVAARMLLVTPEDGGSRRMPYITQLTPSEGGVVAFMAAPSEMHENLPPYSEERQNLTAITNLRVTFTRLNTLGDMNLDNSSAIRRNVGFYRHPDYPINHSQTCQPCNCHAGGSEAHENCDQYTNPAEGKVAGRCVCKANVGGDKCDRCRVGYWNFRADNPDGCEECRCHMLGTLENVGCDQVTGACTCKRFVEGEFCDRCMPGYFNLTASPQGCQPCACSPLGSVGPQCNPNT